MLLHAARGSDVRGLCAMRARRGNIIRPLLMFTPEQLRAYLQSIGQPWREDETNVCQDYARNHAFAMPRFRRWRRRIPMRGRRWRGWLRRPSGMRITFPQGLASWG